MTTVISCYLGMSAISDNHLYASCCRCCWFWVLFSMSHLDNGQASHLLTCDDNGQASHLLTCDDNGQASHLLTCDDNGQASHLLTPVDVWWQWAGVTPVDVWWQWAGVTPVDVWWQWAGITPVDMWSHKSFHVSHIAGRLCSDPAISWCQPLYQELCQPDGGWGGYHCRQRSYFWVDQ